MQEHSFAGKSILKLAGGIGSLRGIIGDIDDAPVTKLKKHQVTINIGKKVETIQSRLSLRVNLFNSIDYQKWMKTAQAFDKEHNVEQ